MWAAIDRQDTTGWTPEVLDGLIAQAKNFDDLDHLLFSLQYARDVTYNRDGNEARDNRMRVTGLMDRVLATRLQWLARQNQIATQVTNQTGWFPNPSLVPPENYTGASNDVTQYAQNIVNHYGGLTTDDQIKRRADMLAAQEKARAEAEAAKIRAAQAARDAAAAAAAAAANPTAQNAMQATAAQLAQQTAEHQAQAAQTAAAAVTGETQSGGLLKLGGLLLTLYSLAK